MLLFISEPSSAKLVGWTNIATYDWVIGKCAYRETIKKWYFFGICFKYVDNIEVIVCVE